MRSKAQLPTPSDLRADRQRQLEEFIRTALNVQPPGPPGSLLAVARSPESAVISAVFALSGVLEQRHVDARLVLLSGAAGERWTLSFPPGFLHETRIAADPRLSDAHEQLVIGQDYCWFGDCMRREPERRDAFEQFNVADAVTTQRARATFERLWALCRPLYRNAPAEAAALVATTPPGDVLIAQGPLATLGAWRPSSQH